jgi:dTDP-glucose 4,6-dehydratase
MRMRILIFGANGWIGQQFQSVCSRACNAGTDIEYRASGVCRISLDMQSEIIDEIVAYKPTHVVSFVGRTHGTVGDRVYSTIDYLEQDDKLNENLRDNLAAPLLLAYLCKHAGIHFTYLGTGCIFSYRDGEDVERMLRYDGVDGDPMNGCDHPREIEKCYKFKESDAPNFFGSSYSIVKGYTDRIMQERNCICESVLNLRIRMPIVARDNPRNFITKIANYAKVCSLPNSMTVLDEFLPYALVLMQYRHTGTLNFVNPGVISHNEILRMYRAHVKPDFTWANFTVAEQNDILASKRSNNYLDNTKLLSIFPKARPIYDAVQHCMRTYNNNNNNNNNNLNISDFTESELYLDKIECTLRLRAGGDPDNNKPIGSYSTEFSVAGMSAVKTAATYAEKCTRILSATVGELYTKILSNAHAPSSAFASAGATATATCKSKIKNDTPASASASVSVSNVSVGSVPAIDSLVDSPSTVICITGGAGFIGSHYVNYVWNNYAHIRIVNIDCLYYCANPLNVDECVRTDANRRYVFIKLNLASPDAVSDIRALFSAENVSHVVHFAAQSHVQNSFGESLQYTQDNVVGTHNLLEAARQYGALERFVHVSTDEVYGESMLHTSEQHKTEQSVLCPTNPYAATKAAAELIAQSYYHSFKLPLIITRGNNVYGPNQYPEKLIPRFIQFLKEGRKLPIQGDGAHLRSFIHVSDVCRAFDTILNRGSVGEIYNIGSDKGSEYSVMDVAKLLIKLVKGVDINDHAAQQNGISDVDWIEYVEDRPFNDRRYYISSDKLKHLGWCMKTDFINGLTELIQ